VLIVPAVFGIVAPLAGQPASGQELLEFVREAHRASRDLIRTCSCRVEFSGTATATRPSTAKIEPCSGRFWYSPDALRTQVSELGHETDNVRRDSVLQTITRQPQDGKALISATRRAAPNRHESRCDAWVRGLLVFNVPSTTEYVPFEELVARATRVSNVKRRTEGGKEMIVVQLFFEQL
jgi:hypothetical protein